MGWVGRHLRESVRPSDRFDLHMSGGQWHATSPGSYVGFLLIDAVVYMVKVAVAIVTLPIAWLVRVADGRRGRPSAEAMSRRRHSRRP